MHPTLLFDRGDRSIFEVTGKDAVATLNGLVTNDVAALEDGHGEYAAVLTARGKITADLYIMRRGASLILSTSLAASEPLRATLAKYVNPRFATWRDLDSGTVTVVGDDALSWCARATTIRHDAMPTNASYAHASSDDGETIAVSIPAFGIENLPSYDVITSRARALEILSTGSGAMVSSPGLLETLRVEAGRPAYGVDMDETTLAGEANLDELHGVSYTKGCYIGQETVARVHFRGHVNRNLRRLSFAQPVPSRTELFRDGGVSVGEVRSSAISATLGAIGIGMVRREVAEGGELVARWDGNETTVTVGRNANGAID